MEFCHIVPTNLIDQVQDHKRHLVLAHLIDKDPIYTQKYKQLSDQGKTIIMDNSAFEMFKQGKPMFDSDKLIDLGKKVGATYIVLSDFPMERWTKTLDKGIEMAEKIHGAGFKTFYVPQSQLNDFEGWSKSVQIAINLKDKNNFIFDIIGISILSCPIALGLKENKYNQSVDSKYRNLRYKSRFNCLKILQERNILNDVALNRLHCLGMTEGPNEIILLHRFWKYFCSWDTSSAVWHGLNGIQYDKSVTGLKNGKYEKEVDFSCSIQWNDKCKCNINYIDGLVDFYNSNQNIEDNFQQFLEITNYLC